MAETTLPVDPEKSGNAWCEACQQSLPAGRATAHLSSKKHQQSLEPVGEPKKARARAPKAMAPAEAEDPDALDAGGEPKAPREKRPAKRRATPGGLIADPSKSGNYWCGLCAVSLTPSKAEGHATTARHQANEKRTLTAAMRSLNFDDK